MKYRIRYAFYTIDAASADEAKSFVVGILQRDAARFVSVEKFEQKRSVFSQLFFGP